MAIKNNNPGRILKGTKSQPSLKGASGVWTLDEALQYHRANQWPQPNLFQPVSNSLRFKGNSPASYLIRQNARAGSSTTGTISFWTKLGASSNDQHFFQTVDALGGSSAANRLYMAFTTGTGTMYIYGQDGLGSQDIYFVTTQGFRDFSAWYHIVIAIDSTQATQANRFKLYVNGVQITSFTTATYPSQGAVIAFTTNATTLIGCNRGPSLQYAGEMSEFIFVDGYALQPTLFGQFDTNNVWVPVPYTGSYGTNGFYLPFNNATTSQTLGYDFSNFTSYSVDQDPYRGSVSLHLTGNGPAGAQNNSFADSSTNNLAITRQGTPTQGSFSPFPLNTNAPYNPAVNGASMFTSTSLSSNNYLTTAATSALEFGAGNFTIELWWYPTSTTRQALYHGSAGADWSVGIDFNSTGVQSIGIWASSNGTSWNLLTADPGGNSIGTLIVNQNAWNHVAYVRNGTTWQSYLNGVLDKNLTGISGTITNRSANGKNIGSWWNTTAMSTATGYISSFRIITGQAVYNGSFTPTMRPFGTLTNNLVTFSEDYTQWGATGVTVTSSATVAPDGTPSGIQINALNGGGTFAFVSIPGSQPSGTITFSAYLKAKEITTGSLFLTQGGNNGAVFDLINGSVSSVSGTGNTATITNAGNGWWRCSVTNTGGTTASGYRIGPSNGALNTYSFNGSIYAWGAQVEQASSVGNYVPTPANYSTAPSLLLNFANAAVVDSAGANTVTTFNSASISSASRYGSGALTFNGTSDYMTTPANPSWVFGTGAFTIEFWHYSPTIGSNTCILDFPSGLMIRQNSNNSLLTYSRSSGTQLVVTGTNTLMPNVWSHVAVTRLGTTMTVWINGTNQGQWSLNDSLGSTSGLLYIGAFLNTQVSPFVFQGQLDDIRVTNGVARYIANFTPPARALPETGGKSFVTQNINAGVVKSFTATGTSSWTAPTDVTQVEILVVAGGGGGGGGNNAGGGGGAGGVIYNNQYPVTPGQAYTVTVGGGGTGGTINTGNATAGGNSQFGNLIAIGGGQGGFASAANTPGYTGGSGGGGSAYTSGTPAGGSGTAGQGFSGGAGYATASNQCGSGGGGGAGALGVASTQTQAGAGGAGLQFGISGTPTYYAGGGGGGAYQPNGSIAVGAGGSGGGGNGALSSASTAGTTNTGGGGGGGGYPSTTGGAGGSGIVVVRYTTTAVGNTSDATTDNLVDSPTQYGHDYGNGGEVVGNYATWNPLDTATSYLKNGNLSNTAGGANNNVRGTIAVSSGKWYWEFTIDQASPTNHHGIWSISETTTTYYIGQTAGSWGIYDSNGNKRNNGSFDAYGSAYTLNDIGMVALDMDNGKIWWGKNGTWFNSGAPAAGTNAAFTNVTGTVAPATLQYSAASYNFGQRAWAYTPPAGFSALTLKNFARPAPGSAPATPNQYFDIVTWTGNASTQTITGLNFQPDFVWAKARSATYDNVLNDVIRGPGKTMQSDLTSAEVNEGSSGLTSFNSNGFSLGGSSGGWNANAVTYVAWCWKAGGAAVTNTNGTITSQVSANIASGFSVVTYTGNNTAGATVGHGLGSIPNMIIVFRRDSTAGHKVWHSSLTAGQVLELQVTNGVQTIAAFNNAVPTSTTFALGAYADTNASAGTFVAYCWTAIPGFSQFGSYAANGSANGPFVYTGFKPKFVMIKRTDSGSSESWFIVDSARSTYNPSSNYILANAASAEGTGTAIVDFLSNGFKPRSTAVNAGAGGPTYVYMAFASTPFTNTNGTAF